MKTSKWKLYSPPRNHQPPEDFDPARHELEFMISGPSYDPPMWEPLASKPAWLATLKYRYRLKSAPPPLENSLPEDDAKRAQYPMADGLIDYFPNALAEVSRVSFIGSQKHNKGEPMHWARGKSTDHRNKIARHLVDAGGVDVVMVDGKEERVRHSAYLAWRALANLQDELEREEGYPPSRASRF